MKKTISSLRKKIGDITYVLPAEIFRSISKKAAEHYVSLDDILKHFLAGAGQLSLSGLDLNTEIVDDVQIKRGYSKVSTLRNTQTFQKTKAYYYLEITLNDKTRKPSSKISSEIS